MRSYSVASFGVDDKNLVKLIHNMLSSNTTEECFKSTRSIEGRDLYLTKIISDIGELVTASTAMEYAAIITKYLLS